MIEVDISKLTDLIESYEEYIRQMDKNNLELIEEFNAIRQFWHDQKCINMYSSFELEKKRIIKNAENIKSIENIYKFIRHKYKQFGTKLTFNTKKYDKVIEKIDKVRNELKWILNRYDNLDYNFYPKANIINNQKNSLSNLLDSFDEIREDIVNNYKTIKNIENEVQEMSSSLNIELFSFNNYESEV